MLKRNLTGLSVKVLILITFFFSNGNSQSRMNFVYLNPTPGSQINSRETTVTLRPHDMDSFIKIIKTGTIKVKGKQSGSHSYKIIFSKDRETVIIKPNQFFEHDEWVNISISDENGDNILDFSFKIEPEPVGPEWAITSENEIINLSELREQNKKDRFDEVPLNASSLPADLYVPQILFKDNPTPGYIFITNRTRETGFNFYMQILTNQGQPVFYKRTAGSYSNDFKVCAPGKLSYHDLGQTAVFVMDTSYKIIDTVRCGNGYSINNHDIQFLPNGHILCFAWKTIYTKMDTIVAGGNPKAAVIWSIVQELDEDKNVIFEWRSWEHLDIHDVIYDPALKSITDLKGSTIDAVHCNAIFRDTDGNILLSHRNTDEVIKLNRQTGEIMWRLGGASSKNNQFTFVDDEFNGFSHQHNIVRLPNGHITLFDNGNLHQPPESRGVEYILDEENKIATQVWEYKLSPIHFSKAQAGVQRLPNGNTMIGWGDDQSPLLTEVKPDGSKTLEMAYPDYIISYRSYRFPWKDSPLSELEFTGNINDTIDYNQPGNNSFIKIGFKVTDQPLKLELVRPRTQINNISFINEKPTISALEHWYLRNNDSQLFTVRIIVNLDSTEIKNGNEGVLFYRPTENYGTFVRLQSEYNEVTNEVSADISGTGEIMLGTEKYKISDFNLTFTSLFTDEQSKKAVTFTNNTSSALYIDEIKSANNDFSFESSEIMIPAKSSITDSVIFHPKTDGELTGFIEFYSSQTGYRDTVFTVGTGIKVKQVFIISTPSVNFGDVLTGEHKDSTITIMNMSEDTLRISGISTGISNSFRNSFAFISIPPGETITDTLTFSPMNTGYDSTWVVYYHNGRNHADSIFVDGIGIMKKGILSFKTGSFDFGSVRIQAIKDSTLELKNTGNAELIITSLSQSENSAFYHSLKNAKLLPLESVFDTIYYYPKQLKADSTWIIYFDNSSKKSDSLLVKGKGIENTNIETSNIPTTYYLSENYPNPFNPSTKISFGFPVSGHVRVTVYDLLGKVIKTVLDEEKPAGNYFENIQLSGSSGIYLYILDFTSSNGTGKFRQTRKMILIK